jgi:CheY-like chemotaxis protein
VFVRDGEEAVKYVSRQPPLDDPVLCPMPSLVLLDGRMPKMEHRYLPIVQREGERCRPGVGHELASAYRASHSLHQKG